MTTKRPTRLVHEDPEFARLVAASNNEGPTSEQLEETLMLRSRVATTSRWTSWRTLGSSLPLGLAVIGATVFGVALSVGSVRSGDADAPLVAGPGADGGPCSADTCAPAHAGEAERSLPTVQDGTSLLTVSADDLAPAPPEADAVATPRRAVRAKAPTPAARSGSVPAPLEHAHSRLAHPEAPREPQTTFAEELALVVTARSALAKGDVRSCIAAVGRYQERFGSGTFAHEIEVISIEAFVASGEVARARSAAERFLETHANSPYADRVRASIQRSNH